MSSHAGKTLIYLEHSETLEFDEENYPDCQILNGNVVFRHDDALMYCDKAFFYNLITIFLQKHSQFFVSCHRLKN